MTWARHNSRHVLERATSPLWDVAWICADCGHIMLGPAAVADGPDFPAVPHRRCPTCRARAWLESVLPARRWDGDSVDCLPLADRRRSGTYKPTNPRGGSRRPTTPRTKEATQ